MDHAIRYSPDKRPLRKGEPLVDRYYDAILKDDKKEFLSVIKDPDFGRTTADVIFSYDALNIGIAVLNGETQGIIDLQTNPLYYAVARTAPRLTNYLLQSGDAAYRFDALGLALQILENVNNEKSSLYDILVTLCYYKRRHLEVIRLIVQSSQCPEYVRKTFIKYEGKRQIAPLAALFLAAPEFFLSSYKKVTDIHDSEEMTQLLDLIHMVGDQFVAYVRLQDTCDQICEQTEMEIAFLLHQVSPKKLGVSSPDYFFRFFKPLTFERQEQSSDDKPVVPKLTWDDFGRYKEKPGHWMYFGLRYIVIREDIDESAIYRLLPTLEPDDEGRLNRSIEKKLSSISGFKGVFEGMTGQISSKGGQKHLPQSLKWFPFLSGGKFEQNVKSSPTDVPSANHMFDFKIAQTWEKKVMKLVKPKLNFLGMLSYFPTVARRLIK